MVEQKTNCDQCGTQILERTAEKTGGVCRRCLKKKPEPPSADYDITTLERIRQNNGDLIMAASVERSGLKDLAFGKLNQQCLIALANQLSGGRAILSVQDYVDDIIRETENTVIHSFGYDLDSSEARQEIIYRLAGNGFAWYYRGLARRIKFDDPRELASNLFLNGRFAWIDCDADSVPAVLIWKIFQAFVCGDRQLLAKYASEFSVTESATADDLFFNFLLAVNARNFEYIKSNENRIEQLELTKWRYGVMECILGIAHQNPKLVANGLESVVKNHRKLNLYNPLESLICVESHGLYELAKSFDSNLVAAFDVESKLPWDKGFQHWLNEHGETVCTSELSFLPDFVRSALESLDRPDCQPE